MFVRFTCGILFLALSTAQISCTCGGTMEPPELSPDPATVFTTEQPDPAHAYRMGKGDIVTLRCPDVRELDGFQTVVEPESNRFTLIGEIKLVGLSPADVLDQIQQRLRPYYDPVEVRLEITARSEPIFLFWRGHNLKLAWTGGDTVVSMLQRAGFSEADWPKTIILARMGTAGSANSTAYLPYERDPKMLTPEYNYVLRPGDILETYANPGHSFRGSMRFTFELPPGALAEFATPVTDDRIAVTADDPPPVMFLNKYLDLPRIAPR